MTIRLVHIKSGSGKKRCLANTRALNHASSKEELRRVADQALNVTKDTGRSRITAWVEEMGKRR